MRERRAFEVTRSKLRSALTNNRGSLAEIDGRSAVARRFKDVVSLHVADLGGEAAGLSEGQQSLARRAAALTVELELLESKFAQQGGALPAELEVYQRASNSLRRLLESLGIHRGRIARDVSSPDLQTYLRTRQGRTINHREAEDVEDD